MISEYCNSLTPIKDLCKKYNLSDRYIYSAIKNGEIQKRKRTPYWVKNVVNDCELKYYLLGLIASDGCLHNNERTIEISLHEQDKNILIDISNGIFGENRVICEEKRNRVRLIISSIDVSNVYIQFGITPRKTATLNIKFEKIPEQYFHHFLRGYIDGDGNYWFKNNNNIHVRICGNENTMNNIKNYIFKYYNIDSYVYRIAANNVSFPFYEWTLQKTALVKQLLKIIYKDANYYIERKYNIIKSVLCAV